MTKGKKIIISIPNETVEEALARGSPRTVGERIQHVLDVVREKGFFLLDDGIVSADFRTVEPFAFTAEQLKHRAAHLQNLARLLPALLQRTDRKGLVGSYQLKHTAEYVMPVHTYVSNGEAILTMLYLGYSLVKTKGDTTPNCLFQCKLLPSDLMTMGMYRGLKESSSSESPSSPRGSTTPRADASDASSLCSTVPSTDDEPVPSVLEKCLVSEAATQ